MKMLQPSLRAPLGLALIILATLVACGGDSGTGPSGNGVTLQGTVLGATASSTFGASSYAAGAAAAAETITVTVAENPAITTTVGADGSFTLRGLPTGSFTLVFSSGGTELGRITMGEVMPNQQITLTVAVAAGTVTVVEEKRNGIGHGDLEIESTISQVLAASLTGDSRFVIGGKTVIARPGQTAIREGNRGRTAMDLTVGMQVHVKGVWETPVGGTQEVLAHEIIIQGGTDDDDDDTDTGGGQPACAAGTKAEIEGAIATKGSSSITIRQHDRDNVCEVDSGTEIRKGNTKFTFADLKTGQRVHVSGRFLGLSGTTCRVDADEIKVQN